MTRYTKFQLDKMNLAGKQESGREMIEELKTMAQTYTSLDKSEPHDALTRAFRDSSIALAELIRHTGIELTDVPWIELTTRRVTMTDESLLVDWIIDNARGLARSLLTLKEGGLDKLLTLSNMFPDSGMPISFAEREGWAIVWEQLPGREDKAMQQFPDGSLVKITAGFYEGKIAQIKSFVPEDGEYLVAYGAKGFRVNEMHLEAAPKPEPLSVAVDGFSIPIGVMGDSSEAASQAITTAHKFKVGDEVKVVNESHDLYSSVGQVDSAGGSIAPYHVKFEFAESGDWFNELHYFQEEELALFTSNDTPTVDVDSPSASE